jgi:DNA-binding response OmpR family regulator
MTLAKILVIEDEEGVRKLIQAALRDSYEVLLAPDGYDGLSQARWAHPDLILLDLRMPRLDGLAVLAQLKGNTHTSHIPVIIVSARGETDALLDGQRGGALDHLIKPFDINELRAMIQKHLPVRG